MIEDPAGPAATTGTPTGRTVHTTTADGTVLDWLVCPAWTEPVEDLAEHVVPDGDPFTVPEGETRLARWVLTNGPDSGPLKERLARAHPLPDEPPSGEVTDGGALTWTTGTTSRTGRWSRYRAGADGFLDWSEFCPTPQYRWAVAATVLEVDQAEWRTLEVASTGPFVLYLDGVAVLRGGRVSYMEPETERLRLRLPSGTSTIHLATWQVALRECRHIARLRIEGLPVRVTVPGAGADEHAARLAETILAEVGSTSWAVDGGARGAGAEADGAQVVIQAPPGLALRVRTLTAGGGGPWRSVRVGESRRVRHPLQSQDCAAAGGAGILSAGATEVEVGVDDPRCPQTRRLPVAALPVDTRSRPVGAPEDWCAEVLTHLAARAGPAALLARHTLAGEEAAVTVSAAELTPSLDLIRSRGDCADFEIVALLLLWHTVPAGSWDPQARREVADALTSIRYWIDQPGLDAMCFFTENHQLVWHVAQTLAGETFAKARFAVDGRAGTEHATQGRTRCAQWLQRKLTGGFSEFDSNAYLAIDSLGLVALIECGQDRDLATAAATLLDRTLISLAANSWQGIHGAAHGRSYVHTQRSARLEETSPILRLAAGVGSLNEKLLPTAALASAQQYRIPEVVRALATETGPQWWGRQVSRGTLVFERDLLRRPYRSDVRSWRTPHVMLSSVQDYRSGLPGLQEHVWAATLAPEAQVYLTHPANADTSGSARPNAWMGHRVLPRVHQHEDVLLGVQRFTPTDPVGATHLWFPVAHFDQWEQRGQWLIARVGSGYVAVGTPGGWRPELSGGAAWQEWWPQERGSAWACLVGDADRDGTFEEFGAQVDATSVSWSGIGGENPGLRVHRPDRAELGLTFESAFTIDGVPAGLDSAGRPAPEAHLQNPAVTAEFDDDVVRVAWGGAEHTLDLGGALRLLAMHF